MTHSNDREAHISAHSLDDMRQLADDALRYGKSIGVTGMMVEASDTDGRTVSVRHGELDTIGLSHDMRIGVTVYDRQRRGQASTGDLSIGEIRKTVSAALDIARFTSEDVHAGLPDLDCLERAPRHLDLFHDWALPVDDAISLAARAERAAFQTNALVQGTSGSSVSSRHVQRVIGLSSGFLEGYAASLHSISCSVIAGSGNNMHQGGWASSGTDSGALEPAESIGQRAGTRAAAHIDARKLTTRKVPVLFESTQAVGLLQAFVEATSGASLYQRMSFLNDCLGTLVFASHVQIDEDPHIERALGSAPFDREGVRATRRQVVKDGSVVEYFLSSYSARKLGLRSTGNAGGVHNLSLSSTQTRRSDDLDAMLRRLDTGLFVTELMGQRVNSVTGGYSRGAAGFWVENGQIQYPVHEITIASTLQEMFRHIVAIGDDTYIRGPLSSGSILIDAMTVAGS